MKFRSLPRVLAIACPLLLLLFAAVFLFCHRGVDRETSEPAGSQAKVETAAPPEEMDVFSGFVSWSLQYRKSDATKKRELIERGVALASARAEAMSGLIESDPEEALRRAISLDDRETLPAEVREHLEEPFSLRGAMDVFPLCSNLESHDASLGAAVLLPGHRRQGVRIEMNDGRGNILDAYVFGRREGALSRDSIALQGVRLHGRAAVREEMFTRVLPHEEDAVQQRFIVSESGTKRDFLTGEEIETTPILALSGGRLFAFSNLANLQKVNQSAARLEENIGPENGSQLLFTSRLTLGHEPLDLDAIEEEGEVMSEIWSNTTRSAIVILVDFSDKTGTPINATTLQDRFDGEVHDQVASMSFHKTGISATVDPRVFRMPHPSTYYNGKDDGSKKNSTLFNDAIAAANAAGLTTTGYNHRCIIFKGIGMGYCGLATVGGSKIWLPCHGSKVIVHELGHNFGLSHASFWNSTNSDPVDPDGSSSEYGDNTSIMGGGGVTSGHFHVQGKRKLNWLETNQRHVVGTGDSSRVLRIYRFDHEDTAAGNQKRAIRVTKGDDEFYWLGYRQRFTGSSYQHYLKGIQLHWEQKGKSKSWLIDMNPGGSKNDSGLPLGRTYSDAAANVHITPLKRGGASPNQWVDVQVNVGAFAGNQPPLGTLNLPSRYPVNVPVPLGSSVTDPDGDALAYYFDLGTGVVVGNDATLPGRNYTWTSTGTKNVTLKAYDRKGGGLIEAGSVQIQNEISAPVNVVASDNAHFDRVEVSWNTVGGAGEYKVYRSESASAFTASLIGTVLSPSLAFSDSSALPGISYHYFVQALGSSTASAYSAPDAGLRAEGPPAQPANLTVSQNLFPDRIRISWNGDGTATSFEIWRSASDDIGAASMIGETADSSFDDVGATAGILTYYWVRAKNGFGSVDSDSASGSRKVGAPGSFLASQGSHPDSVALTWNAVANVSGYEIYGGTSSDSVESLLGTTSDLFFSHSPPGILALHWYRVRAVGAGSGPGEWADAVSGYRTFSAPRDVSATQRRFDDRVRLEWEKIQVPLGVEISYEIWRGLSGGEVGDAELIASTSGLVFEDFGIVAGEDYDYWIRGVDAEGANTSGFSSVASGASSEFPPYQPDQKIGNTSATQFGNDLYNLYGGGQTVSRSLKRARKVRFYSEMQNDGIYADTVKLITSRNDRFFRVQVREQFGAFRNVSAATGSGTYSTDEVPVTGARMFLFTASPKSAARKKRVRRNYFLWSVSANDLEHQDRVRAAIKIKKQRRSR